MAPVYTWPHRYVDGGEMTAEVTEAVVENSVDLIEHTLLNAPVTSVSTSKGGKRQCSGVEVGEAKIGHRPRIDRVGAERSEVAEAYDADCFEKLPERSMLQQHKILDRYLRIERVQAMERE